MADFSKLFAALENARREMALVQSEVYATKRKDGADTLAADAGANLSEAMALLDNCASDVRLAAQQMRDHADDMRANVA